MFKLKDIRFSPFHLGIAVEGVEAHSVVWLGGEYKVGHCYASAVNEEFHRTFVNEDVEMALVALAEAERCPGAQGEVVDIVD